MTDVTATATATGAEEPGPHVGTLSRRIAERRAALGLSVEEICARAAIEPSYLHFLEEHPDAHLSVGSLLRLALVLETTPEALLGGRVAPRHGHGRAVRHPRLRALTREECDVRLAEGGIGRVVTSARRGPVAFLVNYEYTDGLVVFSTDPAQASRLQEQDAIGFEVDRVDDFLSDGWCVLATGRARSVEEHERLSLASFDLATWNDGRSHTLVAITPDEITGRIII